MVKLISAILSLTMLLGAGAAPNSSTITANVPITVGAQMAVYEKSTVGKVPCGNCRGSGNEASTKRCGNCYGDGREDYWVCSDCGRTTGDTNCHCNASGVGAERECRTCKGTGNVPTTTKCSACRGVGKFDGKGTYITDVSVVNSSLPADGKHTDGFWYVFKNLVED